MVNGPAMMVQRIRIFSLLSLLLLFAAQCLVVFHTADHGVLEHSHNNTQQCAICIFSSNHDVDSANTLTTSVALFSYNITYSDLPRLFYVKDITGGKSARAPPQRS